MSWQNYAACRGMNPNVFYPERGDDAGVRTAKQVCAQCPVTAQCLEDAFTVDDTSNILGVRGGLSSNERRAELRRRKAPTKDQTCLMCGVTFRGFPQSSICSDRCRKDRANLQKRKG